MLSQRQLHVRQHDLKIGSGTAAAQLQLSPICNRSVRLPKTLCTGIRCWLNQCSVHFLRLVPLSEGRIAEDGTLQCSYHGWCFDSEGACTSVPQAENPEQEHTAAAHTRACATVYPTQVCLQHQTDCLCSQCQACTYVACWPCPDCAHV